MIDHHGKIVISRIVLLTFFLSLFPELPAFTQTPSRIPLAIQSVVKQYDKNLEALGKSDPQLQKICKQIRTLLQSEKNFFSFTLTLAPQMRGFTLSPALAGRGETFKAMTFKGIPPSRLGGIEGAGDKRQTLREMPLSLQPEKWRQPVGMMLTASGVSLLEVFPPPLTGGGEAPPCHIGGARGRVKSESIFALVRDWYLADHGTIRSIEAERRSMGVSREERIQKLLNQGYALEKYEMGQFHLVRRIKGGMEQDDNDQQKILDAIQLFVNSTDSRKRNDYFAALKELEHKIHSTTVIKNPEPILDKLFTALSIPTTTMTDKRWLAKITCESLYLLSIRNQYSLHPVKITEELKKNWLKQLKTVEDQMDKEDVNGNGLEYALDVLENGIRLLQITKSTTDQVREKAKEIAKEHLSEMKAAIIGLLLLDTSKASTWVDSIVSDIFQGIITVTYKEGKKWESKKLYKRLLTAKVLEWNLNPNPNVNLNNHLSLIDQIANVLENEKSKKIKHGDWQVYYAGLEALEHAVWKSTDKQVQEKAWNVIAGYSGFKEFHLENNWRVRQKVAESLTLFMTHPSSNIKEAALIKWKEMELKETKEMVKQTLKSRNYAEIKTELKKEWQKTKSDMEQMLEEQNKLIHSILQRLDDPDNNNANEELRTALKDNVETYKTMVGNYKDLGQELGLLIEKTEAYQKQIQDWQESVQNVLQSIDNRTGQILKELQELRAVVVQRKINSTVPPRLQTFTGRENLLQKIEQQLGAKMVGALAQASMVGSGGVGKSTLAFEYAYRSLEKQKYGFVWWIKAETQELMHNSLLKLAEVMGLWRMGEKADEGIQRMFKRLIQYAEPWLLIYDNAEDPDHLEGFLPQGGNGHILITSRNPNWENAIRVETLPRKESVEFLRKLTDQEDDKGADEIAGLLGDLPLALTQAGEYMKQTGTSYREYCKLFAEQRNQLWELEKPPVRSSIAEEKKTVSTVWQISMKKVEEESAEARALMGVMAFLAPEDIPREMLLHFVENRVAAINNNNNNQPQTLNVLLLFNRAIGALQKYSFITVTDKGISLHRLVQLVVRDTMTKDQQKKTVEYILKLIRAGFTFNKDRPETWKQSEAYLSHAKMSAGYGEQMQVEMGTVADLYDRLGEYISIVKARYAEALQLYQNAYRIGKDLFGENHPDVAASSNDLGNVYYAQGKYDQATEYYQKFLKIRLASFEKNHPDVAGSYNNLGNVYKAQGKYDEAIEYYQKSLKIYKAALREDHPDMAGSYNNLGSAYRAQRKYEQALENYERALKIQKEVLGENHPAVARSYNNIGTVYHAQGKYDQALENYERALKIQKEVLGENHPDVAESYNNLGGVYYSQGKYDQAIEYSQKSLKIYRAALGEDHPDVAAIYNNIGRVYHAQGKYEQALENYKQALKIHKKVLGENHPHTKLSEKNIRLVKDDLKIQKDALGENHPKTKLVQENIQVLKDSQKSGCIIALRGNVTLKKTAVGHELWALSFLKKGTSDEAQSPRHKAQGRLVPLIRMMKATALALGWKVKIIVHEFKSAHVWMIKPVAELLSLGVSELKDSKVKGVIHITTAMVEILNALGPGNMGRIVREIVRHEWLEYHGMSHEEALSHADPILLEFLEELKLTAEEEKAETLRSLGEILGETERVKGLLELRPEILMDFSGKGMRLESLKNKAIPISETLGIKLQDTARILVQQ